MMGEIDLYGVFVPALALWMAVAFALGLYVALLGGVVTLAHRTLQ